MLGSLKARVGSLNVNYRYVAEELQYLLGRLERPGRRGALAVRADARRGAAGAARTST